MGPGRSEGPFRTARAETDQRAAIRRDLAITIRAPPSSSDGATSSRSRTSTKRVIYWRRRTLDQVVDQPRRRRRLLASAVGRRTRFRCRPASIITPMMLWHSPAPRSATDVTAACRRLPAVSWRTAKAADDGDAGPEHGPRAWCRNRSGRRTRSRRHVAAADLTPVPAHQAARSRSTGSATRASAR